MTSFCGVWRVQDLSFLCKGVDILNSTPGSMAGTQPPTHLLFCSGVVEGGTGWGQTRSSLHVLYTLSCSSSCCGSLHHGLFVCVCACVLTLSVPKTAWQNITKQQQKRFARARIFITSHVTILHHCRRVVWLVIFVYIAFALFSGTAFSVMVLLVF